MEDKERPLDKRAPESYRNYEPETIEMCRICNGLRPCWCGHSNYMSMWKFIFNAVKGYKGH